MESYWKGWGFSDSIPVTINATPKKIDILKKELTKSFPNSPIEDLDSRNFIIYSSDEDLKKIKKFVTILNGKAYYNLGGKTTGQLVYVLYSPTNQALEVLNKNGSTKNNWWKSNLDRKASDKLVDDLVAKRLMAGAIVYVGDPQYIRMKNGGNVGEAMASSNPYIGGAKAIQGIAPQSISALDSKIASRISPDPNRPIFFNKGGLTPKEKLLKELQKLQRELNSSRLRTYYIDDYSENEIARKRERESKLKRFNEILEILNSMPNQMKRGGMAEQNKIRKVMHEFKEGELHSSSGQKVTDRKQAIAIALSEAGVNKYVGGGGVDIIAPFGTLVSKNKRQKLEYKKVGSNFEFMIYEGVNNPVSNYSRTSFKKSKNGSIIMNYDEFLKFIYSNGFVDEQKYVGGGGVSKKEPKYFVFEVSYSMRKRGENRNQAGIYKQTITESATTEKGAEREAIKTIRSMHKYENVVFNHIAPKLIKEMTLLEYIESQRPRKYDNGGSVEQNDYSVARIILQQLGGQGKLVVMTGANNFIAFSNGVSFKLKSRKANYVKITLNGNDLYDIQFQKLFGMKSKVVAEYNDIYFDQLIPIVEKETGMYLKMFKKGGMVSTQNRDMVISQLKTIHHHEQEMLQTLKNSGEVEAWVLAKVSNASSDLSDIAHYLEFK